MKLTHHYQAHYNLLTSERVEEGLGMGIKLLCVVLGAAFAAFAMSAQSQLGMVSSRRGEAEAAREEARKQSTLGRQANRESWYCHFKALAYTAFAVATLFLIILVLTGDGAGY